MVYPTPDVIKTIVNEVKNFSKIIFLNISRTKQDMTNR